MNTCQCKHSLKRNRQDDCQYVHDEILYISSRLHQLSRAVMHCWTDGSFLGWHCVMLITYVNIAFIGEKHYTVPAKMNQWGQPGITALHNWWIYEEICKTSSCTYWQSFYLFLFRPCFQWGSRLPTAPLERKLLRNRETLSCTCI